MDNSPGRLARVYPVQTLPPEILAEIFVNFLPPYPEFPPLSGLLSPLLLCRICQQWRTIALSTPALWSSIRITAALGESNSQEVRKFEILTTWLARSRNCPLSLSLSGACHSQLMPDLLQAIQLHRERWEYLDVLIDMEDIYSMHWQDEMPLLRHITFGPDGFYPGATEPPPTLFEHAPLLTSVVLDVNFLTDCMRLPWGNLTHLEAQCFYEHECTDVLRDATKLVYCKLSVTPDDLDEDAGSAVPVHLHLRDLILRPKNHNVWQWEILDNLTLPALRTLQVAQPNTTLDSLQAFLLRSQCALEELRITGATTTESVFREALPKVGTIKLEGV
ncbi:hypothetical protein C8F04DRAFT_1075033 [Mycena alexandri]|uniref:F-box domain-containing protein n=1 Tax=Mycena alexandri TaxID=1745969 RepID=A0AAD6TF91_9AGAR|nr:hypothetical protein C8F04DRAFT_1075033 [Mycena alexandri]